MIQITIEISDSEFKQCLFCGIRDSTGKMIDIHSLSTREAISDKEEVILALAFIEMENITSIKIIEEVTDELGEH